MARVRYFAAAEEFAGRAEEHRVEPDVATLRRALTAEYPALAALGKSLGLAHVEACPLVRSSFEADRVADAQERPRPARTVEPEFTEWTPAAPQPAHSGSRED